MTASAPPTVEETDSPPTLRVRGSGGKDGVVTFEISGRLGSFSIHHIWCDAVRALERLKPKKLLIQASGVSYCDSTGATMIRELRNHQLARELDFELSGFPEEFLPVLRLLERFRSEPEPCPPREGALEHLGRSACAVLRDLLDLIEAIGEIVVALAHAARHPGQIRWAETMRAAQTAGVNSLPVVALVTGLLGLISAFQGAQALAQYGATQEAANLLGKSLLRELGPLMTAVVLTARTGSMFAAEIGTMRINEEVDALNTMGVNPIRFLVVPRVLAAIVMTPLLTVLANVAGLLGGLLVWTLTLDYSFSAYLSQLDLSLTCKDFLTGLIKATVFGILIAGIGCIRGMQTRGSSSAVGNATTSAVVSGIVLIALTDAVFTIIFHYLQL